MPFSTHLRESCAIILSISSEALPLALFRRSSSAGMFFALSASSPALATMPHLSQSSMRSSSGTPVTFGTKAAASLVFPALSISLMKGYHYQSRTAQLEERRLTCHPIGLFLL